MVLKWYQGVLARRPYTTQAATTAFLFGAGDVLAQQTVEKKGFDKHEWARTGRMVFYGGAIFGPAATKWFSLLNKIKIANNPKATIAARVLTDQTVFASTNLFVFLSTMAFLEGFPARPVTTSAEIKDEVKRDAQRASVPHNTAEAKALARDIKSEVKSEAAAVKADVKDTQAGALERIKQKLDSTYVTALSKNWMVWPFVQVVNFAFVPLEHRVLVVNVVALGWNCYLSYLNSGGDGKKDVKTEVRDVESKVQHEGHEAKNKIENKGHEVKGQLESRATEAKDAASEAVEKVGDKIGEVRDKVNEKVASHSSRGMSGSTGSSRS